MSPVGAVKGASEGESAHFFPAVSLRPTGTGGKRVVEGASAQSPEQ